MLRIERLRRDFGGVRAVDDATAVFADGEVTGLMGPNGAGKTTIFNLITGLVPLTAGRVWQDETEITGCRPFHAARRGVGRTFQHTRIIHDLTAAENALIASPALTSGLFAMIGMSRSRRAALAADATQWLERVGLGHRAADRGADLSYAEQKLVMLAGLLVSGARTMLLDEPTAGLDPTSRQRIIDTIGRLKGPDRTIVLVEHNLDVVRGLCDRVIFLAEGRVIAEGRPEEIERDPRLSALYFGAMGGTPNA
jgi:ABC-type branched-subunit amino acid transport system ATPase component